MTQTTPAAIFPWTGFKFRVVLTLLACTFIVATSGCRIPALCCADPGPALPDDYEGVSSSDNSGQYGIDEFFGDPVLAQLIIQGLVQNQELKIRNQEIQIANNEIMARRGAYLPFLNIGARGGIDKGSRFTPMGAAEDQLTYPVGGRFPDPVPNVGLSTNLFWQIDIWRQLRNSRDAAIQRYYETIDARDYLITRLVSETAEKYYELSALDKRYEFLNQTIELQKQSLDVATFQRDFARGTELGVQRFLAEVRKNESQRFIIRQRIIETENRINFVVGRFPQPVQRGAWDLISLDSRPLNVGVPADLLSNRRDIRAAEREIAASGLDVLVARARFYPRLDISAGVGYEAFHPRYLFDPGAFVANAAGELVAPLINKQAIRADYLSANARQLAAIYNYQRVILDAFTQVVNSLNKVQNYRQSVAIKQEQVKALEKSVEVARDLFNLPIDESFAQVEYVDVLLATRDLLEARTDLIETKQQQLTAIVNAYQALGGGYMWTTGRDFSELFCFPPEFLPYGEMEPYFPVEENMDPSEENIPKPQQRSEPKPADALNRMAPPPVVVSQQE